MNKIILIMAAFFIGSSLFAGEISKAENFKNKISVLKASYNSWNNDISVPECRIVGFSFNSEIIQSENILLKSREQWQYCAEGKNGVTCEDFALGALHQKDVRI